MSRQSDRSATAQFPTGRLRLALDRRAGWIEALVILTTIAVAFVVLGFAAAYFRDYFRIIVIFTVAWLLALLIAPLADRLQGRFSRVPRPVAVMAVLVPIIVLGSLVIIRLFAALADSIAQLGGALPALIANPPPVLDDIQRWADSRGLAVDVVGAFKSAVGDTLGGMTDVMAGLFGSAVGAIGTLVDGIIVVSLAVFMAIDRDRIIAFGLDLTPPSRRQDAILFRTRILAAFAGFVRSQLITGGLYGIWALGTSLVFGLPYALATAVLAGLIMAIPIYGPYVSWLPPVLVALLVRPEATLLVVAVMLVGWFIDENLLAPVVRAGALEMHPIVVMFAFLLGAQLAGSLGAILAIPLGAVTQAFVMEYFNRYRAERGWPTAEEQFDESEPPPARPEGSTTTVERPST